MKIFYAAVTIVLAVLVVSFLQQISAAEGEKAKELFEVKCSICHSIERPKSKTKTKEEWQDTVLRMKNVNRAPLTGEEAEVIIDYLAHNYGK